MRSNKTQQQPNPADYIEAYFDYIRLHFSEAESVKIFGEVTGLTLWKEYEKYCNDNVTAPFVIWQCILTEDEKRKIAEYAYNYRTNFLK